MDDETTADVTFPAAGGSVTISFGKTVAFVTYPDGRREKMTPDEARSLAYQMTEPN